MQVAAKMEKTTLQRARGAKDAVDRVALPVDWAASAICRIGQIPGSYHGA